MIFNAIVWLVTTLRTQLIVVRKYFYCVSTYEGKIVLYSNNFNMLINLRKYFFYLRSTFRKSLTSIEQYQQFRCFVSLRKFFVSVSPHTPQARPSGHALLAARSWTRIKGNYFRAIKKINTQQNYKVM